MRAVTTALVLGRFLHAPLYVHTLHQLYQRTRQVLMAHQERPISACSW